MATELSVWLVPAAGDDATLRALIERYAKALGSPSFPPHVTMGTDPAVTILSVVGPAAELRLTLSMDRLEFGADYFHGCYLTASDDLAARQLQQRCAATLGAQVPTKYPPHLSLAYGVLDAEQRQAARALSPPLPLRITFTRLALWATEGPVASWHELAQRSA